MTDKIERCVEEKGFGFLDGATPREKSSAGMPSLGRVRGSQTGIAKPSRSTSRRIWRRGCVVQPTDGPDTLIEVNEHHTVIDFDEHGRRRLSKQHEDRRQHAAIRVAP
jgi:hypothetical protein